MYFLCSQESGYEFKFSPDYDQSLLRTRKRSSSSSSDQVASSQVDRAEKAREASWRRILLLIIAITVHNIPGWLEGGDPCDYLCAHVVL